MRLGLIFLLFSGGIYAQNGADLLIKDSKTNVTAPIVQVQKQIVLDDPFLIQFYGVWKASRIFDKQFSTWVDLVLDKKNKEALKESFALKLNTKAKKELVNATKLYLLWNLQLNQSFFNEWLKLSASEGFLDSQFSHAIDELAGKSASKWFVENSIYLTKKQRGELSTLRSKNSYINNSAQAVFNLRSGVNGLALIKRLPQTDELRLRLGDSLILGYAKNNELAKSAKLLKEIYEPVLQSETDVEKLSAYYLLLARLLFQAKAYEGSEHYYGLIPDESEKFLTARAEKLWISMHSENLSKLRGELKTLEMNVFEDKFMPEVHVVSAMANLKLCQFKAAEKNFKDYIRIQKKFTKLAEENLSSKTPQAIDSNDFYLKYLLNHQKISAKEIESLKKIDSKVFAPYVKDITFINNTAKLDETHEIHRKWRNRKKMIESSLRKMRFVKVELLSTMRRLKNRLAKMQTADSVNLRSSGINKNDHYVFPYDGVIFADELFHYQSNLKNLCLRGKL